MIERRFVLTALLLAAGLGGCATTSAPPAPLAISGEIDALVEDALDQLGVVQGISVAVWTPEGVYARGFGVTDVNTGEPVTADTAFYIASSTKSFTALAMNKLAHRGEIDLTMTLNAFAPDANFPDAVAPDKVILRDLLTHTSGIDNGPLAFRAACTGEHTPEINWRLLAASEVNEKAPYGKFRYTNVGYNILTVMTDRKLGVNWQDLVAREIIKPLGLKHTTAYMSEADAKGWSVARPHFTGFASGAVRIDLEKKDNTMQSAGGMIMSANDALRWLELFINDGVVGGKPILPAEVVRETRAPLAEVGGSFSDYKRDNYGLGWYTGPYEGDMLVHHFGGFSGFRAHVSYMPERKVGFAAFVNDSDAGFELPDVIANFVYDRLAGRENALEKARAGIARLVADRDKKFERVAADRAKRAAREWTLSLPREAYAGTYVNELYGTVEVGVTDGDIELTMGNLHSIAEPFTAPDTIRHELIPYSGDVVQFVVEDGAVTGIRNRDGAVFVRQ